MGHFATFADFLQMGKHGLYVWLSYGLAFAIFAYNIVSVAFAKRQFFNKAKRQARREQAKS
ncbi:MAG: heme exporter protein CcmD [Methyloprofundus sp.]|nr:heme exporter protein CcmD [Methyloprofundus sp.]MBW6452358.1 heme exporter protein CcmD [Methyloprofundus sp.]MDF1581794.1 heme exporter protein CcmD [Methyloprofundus sp.]MDT8425596.1 heme exporter protein CcmD [Methyloprofundus sp.]